MKKYVVLLIICCFSVLKSQELKAFQFYNKAGKTVSTTNLVDDLSQYDVVLFGEYHNNSIIHWLQLQIVKDLYKAKNGNIILGAEMFERDNQANLNLYLENKIAAKVLKDSVRLWNNYETDYRPLVDFAKENKLKFIASNVPRIYAAKVAKETMKSLDSSTESEKRWFAKLPVSLTLDTPAYPEMLKMMGEHAGTKAMNFVAAQALKDATMAESILNNLESGSTFIHFNGDFHCKEYGGIYWYLKLNKPNLKVVVISVAESNNSNLAFPTKDYIPTDFTLVVPADMTKTY